MLHIMRERIQISFFQSRIPKKIITDRKNRLRILSLKPSYSDIMLYSPHAFRDAAVELASVILFVEEATL